MKVAQKILAFFFAASRFHFGSAANAARSMPNLRLRNGSETAIGPT
jgi:hypothetical protein